jgi:D-tyrosyl-tRNA(Tyr) deacylase
MKALVQRVSEASVEIDGEVVSAIGNGYLILFGVAAGDSTERVGHLAGKVLKLRIFEDEDGKTNKSITDVGGSIIVVSQFTLYADTAHGRRPGFSAAAPRPVAEPLYEEVVRLLKARLGENRVGTGSFGAEMKVSLVNDGPFSVELVS